MDMKSSQICYGSPEFQLTKAAIAQLGRMYGMPTWGYAGCSDAKVLDEQAALEATLSVMAAALSGANLIHDVGYLEMGLTTSFEMVVLTDELVAMVNNFMKGIEVSAETMMLDELHTVGPGGHFLTQDSTMARFKDFWYPTLLDRSMRPRWEKAGSQTMGERLTGRVQEILEEHQPQPLDAALKAKLDEILEGVPA
jgi:trimethylamine--corrinoid protein Co-methyltransferase